MMNIIRKIPDTVFAQYSVEAQIQHISLQILQFEIQRQR